MAQDLARVDGPRSFGTAALHGLGFLILAALVTVIVGLQQRAAGAYMAEFSATRADEAGHVVTGLMVAQYLGSDWPAPLAFLADYGLHYPRVVLGLWPPLYYVLQGIWFTLLEPSTPAVLLLPAVLAALLVASTGWVAADRLGLLPGVAVGAVLLVLPALREAILVVGLDLPLSLLILWAAFAYAAYLRSRSLRTGLLFGLLASAAILTKATGLALLLLPPMAVLVTRRFRLLRERGFWLPLLLIVILAGPWTIGTYPLVSAAAPAAVPGPDARLLAEAGALWHQLGAVLLALAAAGGAFALADTRRATAEPLPLVLLLVSVCFAATLAMAPPAGPASVLPLCAPAVILAAAGGLRLIRLVTRDWTTLAGLAVALVMLLAALPALMMVATKPVIGMDAAAQTFLADASGPPVVLVFADETGEGALVAAVAQRDHRRRSYVVPARVALAAPVSDPSAANSPSAAHEDLLAGLGRLGAGYLAIEDRSGGADDALARRMEAVLAAHPERFKLLGRFPRSDGTGGTRLFALVDGGRGAPNAAPDVVPGAAAGSAPGPVQ
ncbi:hypothetical protein V5F53_00565 [Xanthobacter sp. V4C-4]|uniref:hypothetical protein n=1 Tax=Xanthobacter cornucopiae TaxID=3119924 RepID=UPI003726FE9B